MTSAELRKIFPNASTQFILSNSNDAPAPVYRGASHADRPAPAPVVERNLRTRPLAKGTPQKRDPDFFLVRITSFRRRLLDEDNLCEKYHVDCCRYAGLIPGDAPETTRIETRQEKVRSKAEERTEIEVIPDLARAIGELPIFRCP